MNTKGAAYAALMAITLLLGVTDRVVALTGAEAMPPESYRFVAYVGDDHGYCTGAIIAPTWVLTAAHCVVKEGGRTISPDEIGDLSRGWPDDDWERVPVKRVISHPYYYYEGDGFRNDIALLELTRPFSSSDLVPVEVLGVEEEARYAANGTTAVMIGYGENEHGQRDREGLFRVLSAPLYHAEACRTEHSFVDGRGEIVHDETVCAGDRERGIRGGDSGGPLLVETEGGAYGLIGIASISGHDPSGHPVVAVYTRVATVKDWIDGCVDGTGECVEGGVRFADLTRHAPDEIRESETLEYRPTAVIFVNETEEALSYHWIDFNGGERFYGAVSPGESASQHTYPGHVWVIKDGNGRTVAVFVAERETARAIVSGDVFVASDDRGGVESYEPYSVADGTDAAWVELDVAGFEWVSGEATDGGTANIDEEITPGTWGGAGWNTIGKPFIYGGAWAVYQTTDGTVVQVVVFGNAVYDLTWSGAAWRMRGRSGWGTWHYGTDPGRIDIELPSASAPWSVTKTTVDELSLPFPREAERLGVTTRFWPSTLVLLIQDEADDSWTAVTCAENCLAYERSSAVAATQTDTRTAKVMEPPVQVDEVTDSATWVELEISGNILKEDSGWIDGGTPNLDEKTTPGTWGASGWESIGKPFLYGGAWAVYRADDGAVVQVAVIGNPVYDPDYAGTAFRVHSGSGWSDWNYGTGRRRMDIELPSGPVTITQAGELNVPFPARGRYRRSLGDTEEVWNTTPVLLIHDDLNDSQTAVGCNVNCDAWQRISAPAVPTVETEDAPEADEAIVTDVDIVPDLSRGRLVRVLDAALAATTWNVHGDEVPDWSTRLRALELAIEITGSEIEVDADTDAEESAATESVTNRVTYTPAQPTERDQVTGNLADEAGVTRWQWQWCDPNHPWWKDEENRPGARTRTLLDLRGSNARFRLAWWRDGRKEFPPVGNYVAMPRTPQDLSCLDPERR